MTLSRWYHRSALALMILAILAYAVASASPEFAVLAGPVVFALWRLSSRRSTPAGGTANGGEAGTGGVAGGGGGAGGGRFLLPRLVVNIMLFAVLAYALLRAQGRLEVETIAQVVVLIQIIKIGDRRAPRDDAQILCLAVFLAIAAMLDSNSIWTGVLLLVFLPLLVTTVMLFQLYQGAFRAGAGGASADFEVERYRRGVRATSAVATLATVMLALVVFVLMPRGIGENVFGTWGTIRKGNTQGFSSSVTLGTEGLLSSSPTVVFDLVLKDSSGQNIGSPDTVQYMRGAVLDDYTASKWTYNNRVPPQTGELATSEIPDALALRTGLEFEQIVSLRAPVRSDRWKHIFALWAPVKVQINGRGKYRFFPDTGVVQVQSDISSPVYHIWSVPFETVAPDVSAAERSIVVPSSERITDLALSILKKAGIEGDPAARAFEEDAAAARVIQSYLQSNYTYTLEMEAPPKDTDPVEHFLFTRKAGHCEYFASAMVLLCRGVGINARMVTGYVATEFSTATGSYTVRESNAHAWAEVENPGRRWQRFDPTPAADLARIHKSSPGLLGRIRNAIEAMEYAWNSSIVAFNEQTRQSLLGPSRGESVGVLGRIEQVSLRLRGGGPRLLARAAALGMCVFLVVASLGIVVQFIVRVVRGRNGGEQRGTHSPQAGVVAGDGVYRRMLRVLSRRRLGKPLWRPPLAHADAISADAPELAGDVRLISESYYRRRFSGAKISPAESAEVRDALERIRRFRSSGSNGV